MPGMHDWGWEELRINLDFRGFAEIDNGPS